jgi:2-oxo-4-hydroxy-4-carboxy--5-ureidoimidazoline (OHCU) decarboxylase
MAIEMTLSSSAKADPRARRWRVAAARDADLFGREGRMQRPSAGVSRMSFCSAFADADADDRVALVQLHGDLAVALDADEVAELVAPHAARAGGEHDVD